MMSLTLRREAPPYTLPQQQHLQAGAHVNTEDANGDTPFTAAAKCANVPIMQLLRQAGADINKTNKQGNNAFDSLNYRAQAQQVLLAIHYLTEIGVKPAATNPLTCASRGQNQSALRLLVEKGYRISPTDHSTEDSALTELIQPHRQAELTEEQIIACIDLLVQAGADVPAMGHYDSEGKTLGSVCDAGNHRTQGTRKFSRTS